jgi:hypothetical protein
VAGAGRVQGLLPQSVTFWLRVGLNSHSNKHRHCCCNHYRGGSPAQPFQYGRVNPIPHYFRTARKKHDQRMMSGGASTPFKTADQNNILTASIPK